MRYHQLQSQFIATKTTALRVLERKLDLEASLRDHKQVWVAIVSAGCECGCVVRECGCGVVEVCGCIEVWGCGGVEVCGCVVYR